jgi:hypothetical protein
VTISDAGGVDILAGTGAGISNAGPSFFTPASGEGAHLGQPMPVAAGAATLAIANAGKGRGGAIALVVGGFNRFVAR